MVGGLSACSSSETSESTAGNASGSGNATYPVTVTGSSGDVVVPARPQRVVSLSPTATESLFAIGAGEQVEAVDDRSTYPTEAPRTALSGFTPNAEAISALRPDLVVLSNDLNGIVESLRRLSVPVLLQSAPTNFDEAYRQIEVLGTAVDRPGPAQALTSRMRDDIAVAVRNDAGAAKGLTYFHEVDNTLYSVTSKTFAGQIYESFGLRNIADAADTSGSGYPQLSAEYVITANPNLVFLADTKCCGQNATTVAARPGWATIDAVRDADVVALDDDIASRWGPRIVDYARAVGAAARAAA